MLKSIWLRLGRTLFAFTWPLRRIIRYTPLFSAPRVRVIVTSSDGQLLLVKTWLGRQRWGFPGGGVGRGESREAAAIRELAEETGLRLDEAELSYVGEITRDEVIPLSLILYEVAVANTDLPALDWYRRLEITDRQWWSPTDSAPMSLSPSVAWYLERRRG